jgi:hypothetical protein
MDVKATARRPKISRRQLFRYGASAGAAATVGPMLPAMTSVAHAGGLPRVLPAPKPIPGGPLIHVFAPGPPDVTLPFTGIQLIGAGRGAQRDHRLQGLHRPGLPRRTATGSDGKQYNLETDMRAMQGTYVATDGSR